MTGVLSKIASVCQTSVSSPQQQFALVGATGVSTGSSECVFVSDFCLNCCFGALGRATSLQIAFVILVSTQLPYLWAPWAVAVQRICDSIGFENSVCFSSYNVHGSGGKNAALYFNWDRTGN